jgi:site-specific DNA-methyltransferase (adenine-specific)
MARVEHIGAATLYLGDAREIVPGLPKSALVCTDPPYLVSKGGYAANLQLEGGFGGWMKDYGNQGDIVQCDIKFAEWLPIVFDALDGRAQAYFMTNGRNLKDMQTAAEGSGFRLHTILVWDKRAALPNKYYQNVTEFGLFMFKGNARTINDPASKNLVTIFQRDESPHPTEKPVELMRLWIGNSSRPGDIVLDPFMGSGTSGVAALQLNRAFIGVALDPGYFDIACRRIEDAQRQGSLFTEAAA